MPEAAKGSFYIRKGIRFAYWAGAEVLRAGELPAGWLLVREYLPVAISWLGLAGGEMGYDLSAYCPRCQPWVKG